MLNRQEQYWLECWRRSQSVQPATTSGRQPYRLGAIQHGLYAARILNAEERALVEEWQALVADLRAQYPAEGDRIDLLVIYWLFLFRAVRAEHGKAIERAGRAIRTHMRKLSRPHQTTMEHPANRWGPEEQHAWKLRLLAEIKKRRNIAINDEESELPHA
ncbi:MAG: hypothetical protein ACYDBB_10800 [Armatimonadota bacterium]